MPVDALVLRGEKGSPLTAAEMDNNLRKLRNFGDALEQLLFVVLNNDGTLKDGAVSTAAKIADGIITRAKLAADAKTPSGTVVDFAGSAIPTGWLECDGTAVNRTTYADLFAAIGTTWGVGDGSTTFNVPDLRRRTTVGAGGSGTGTLGNALGNLGGAEDVTLVANQLPATLSLGTVTNNWDNGGGVGGSQRVLSDEEFADGLYTATQNYTNSGGGQPHSNIQPSAIMKKIIRT